MNKSLLTIISLLFTGSIYSQSLRTKINENRFIEQKKNKYGVTDSLNKTIVPFKYDHIEFSNMRLIVRNKNLCGLLSLDNKELIPLQNQFVLPREKERFIVWIKNSLSGLFDINGNTVIPLRYKSINSVINDVFYITENAESTNGVYDYYGKNIIPEEYKFYTIDSNKIFAVKNNKAQILDIQNSGNSIDLERDIQFVETARHYSMGEIFFQIVKKNNKFGLINSKNETIIPIIYDEVKSSQNWRYFIIKQNNKVGLIHVNGNIIKNPIYDRVELRKEFIVLKTKNNKDEVYAYQYH